MTRFIGIDEAGYGPNLGPLVMVAVVAVSQDDREPDPWADLPQAVCRAGGPKDRLWVDDSKAILKGGKGRDRLERAASAVVRAATGPLPATFGDLIRKLSADSLDEIELSPWLENGADPPCPWPDADLPSPLVHPRWRIIEVRVEIAGPRRFNDDLERSRSKSDAHFAAFARLLGPIWEAIDDQSTRARCDKHGGRNFYYSPLQELLHPAWIDRLTEGTASSRYVAREGRRVLDLEFLPRADSASALVALASIVAKSVREIWMDHFNEFWSRRIPGLARTAGYPVDARRFRQEIEETARRLGREPRDWWRER